MNAHATTSTVLCVTVSLLLLAPAVLSRSIFDLVADPEPAAFPAHDIPSAELQDQSSEQFLSDQDEASVLSPKTHPDEIAAPVVFRTLLKESYVDGFLAGLRAGNDIAHERSRRHHSLADFTDLSDVLGYPTSSDILRRASRPKRTISQPGYMGFGQDAAGAALDTYTSILEEEAKRIERARTHSGPVKFIG